jgi:hypothetical protein
LAQQPHSTRIVEGPRPEEDVNRLE